MTDTADQLITRLGLRPHPEGGWYRELHRSPIRVRRTRDGLERGGITAIAFLLTEQECSRWHRVSGADEIWHHGGGAPLELWRLPPRGGDAERLTLGPLSPEEPSRAPLGVVPADWWQAARSLGPWTLAYCCVGPGFDFGDFALLRSRPPEEWPPGADQRFL